MFSVFINTRILTILAESLSCGIVPSAFKVLVVKPLLKRNNLDPKSFINYRPISNLPFLSTLLERVVANQLDTFLPCNTVFESLSGGVLSWFRSYLSDRLQCVSIGEMKSDLSEVACGVALSYVRCCFHYICCH